MANWRLFVDSGPNRLDLFGSVPIQRVQTESLEETPRDSTPAHCADGMHPGFTRVCPTSPAEAATRQSTGDERAVGYQARSDQDRQGLQGRTALFRPQGQA